MTQNINGIKPCTDEMIKNAAHDFSENETFNITFPSSVVVLKAGDILPQVIPAGGADDICYAADESGARHYFVASEDAWRAMEANVRRLGQSAYANPAGVAVVPKAEDEEGSLKELLSGPKGPINVPNGVFGVKNTAVAKMLSAPPLELDGESDPTEWMAVGEPLTEGFVAQLRAAIGDDDNKIFRYAKATETYYVNVDLEKLSKIVNKLREADVYLKREERTPGAEDKEKESNKIGSVLIKFEEIRNEAVRNEQETRSLKHMIWVFIVLAQLSGLATAGLVYLARRFFNGKGPKGGAGPDVGAKPGGGAGEGTMPQVRPQAPARDKVGSDFSRSDAEGWDGARSADAARKTISTWEVVGWSVAAASASIAAGLSVADNAVGIVGDEALAVPAAAGAWARMFMAYGL